MNGTPRNTEVPSAEVSVQVGRTLVAASSRHMGVRSAAKELRSLKGASTEFEAEGQGHSNHRTLPWLQNGELEAGVAGSIPSSRCKHGKSGMQIPGSARPLATNAVRP